MHGLKLPTQHQPLSLRQCAYIRPTVKRHIHRGSNGASRLAISADLSHPLVRAAVKVFILATGQELNGSVMLGTLTAGHLKED